MHSCDARMRKLTSEGNTVSLFHLTNGRIEIEISTYGATIMSVRMPDRTGVSKNIVGGLSDPFSYYGEHPYLGASIGRCANRIGQGRLTIDGCAFQLPKNDGHNHLHGGVCGFDRKEWELVTIINEYQRAGVVLSYTSADGEEGYPGELRASVSYILDANDTLAVTYTATTSKPTVVNLTNHSYFNLSGFDSPTIHEHIFWVNAHFYTLKDEHNVPAGKIAPVRNTVYDFSQPRPLGADIPELEKGVDMGYDVNYVLGNGYRKPSASLKDPCSGRMLEVYTDQPGLQVYTANWWDGSIKGEQGCYYGKHAAVALETQAFPNAPNNEHFPDIRLWPGQEYRTTTVFKFLNQ